MGGAFCVPALFSVLLLFQGIKKRLKHNRMPCRSMYDLFNFSYRHGRNFKRNAPHGFIRALAKLSGAIKIADTRNQGEAESEAFSAIAVTF